MESPIESTIEKIKLETQATEAKLKEKRIYEEMVESLNRDVHDALTHASKLKQDHQEAIKRTDALKLLFEKEKVYRSALSGLLENNQNELKIFQDKYIQGVSTVRIQRSLLGKSVQNVSDQCDVWALFSKPKSLQLPMTKKLVNENIKCPSAYDLRLQNAIERLATLQAERNRLQSEPDAGEEFLRNCLKQQRACRLLSTKVEASENEPIKFSTSGAARKTILPVMKKGNTDMPWYQPISVVGSVAVFLIYFCILREENDVDLEFNKTLYERIHGLEKEQLLQSYRYNKENGLSVTDIEKRLKEIEEEELETS